jgi:hypothetical protein
MYDAGVDVEGVGSIAPFWGDIRPPAAAGLPLMPPFPGGTSVRLRRPASPSCPLSQGGHPSACGGRPPPHAPFLTRGGHPSACGGLTP